MNGTKRAIKLYHAFTFFFSLLFWAPIFYEYQKQMGLNDGQILGIQSLYYLSFCLLELPTGYLADRYGQRWSLRWAAFFLMTANIIPIFYVSYQGFLLHWILVALARSMMSGSASAYLYDYLERSGETEWYRATEGRAYALSLLGRVAAWSVVGYLMEWHITLPYWLTTIAGFTALIISGRFPKGEAIQGEPTFRACFRALATTPRLWLVMGAGLSIFVLARLVQINLFQPLLASKSYTVAGFGVVMGLTTLVEAAASAWAEPVLKRFGELNSIFWVGLAMACSTALLPSTGWVGSFLLLSIIALACGVAYPAQRKLLNDAIPTASIRSSLMSIESLIDRLVCSGMAATMAVFMERGQLDLALRLAGGLSLMISAGLLYAFTRWRTRSLFQ